jgi:hypothetical protein
MKIELVYPHLENCNGQRVPKRLDIPAFTSQLSTSQNGQNSFQKPSPKMERLAHLNYSLLKETALRKKLVELGIPAAGSRQQLERRHIEWVTLWNANCDSSRPRKKGELLNDLDVWEKTQGMRAPSLISSLNSGSQVLSKDFDGAGWAAKHGQSFQDLIASARRGVGEKGSPKSFESKHNALERSDITPGGVGLIDAEIIVKEERTDPSMTDPTPDALRQNVINSYEQSPTAKYLPLERTLNSREGVRLVGNVEDPLTLSASSQRLNPSSKCELEDENNITGDLDIITARPEAL